MPFLESVAIDSKKKEAVFWEEVKFQNDWQKFLVGLLYNQHDYTKSLEEADVAISRKKKKQTCKVVSFPIWQGKHAVLCVVCFCCVDQSSWVLFSPTLK